MGVRTLSVTILCFWVMGQAGAASAGEMWINASELAALPRSGPAWESLKSAADSSPGTPDLADQDESTNVYVMAKALMFAATHEQTYFDGVATALQTIVNSGTYSGRALAIGRKLAAYVVAADLVDLKTNDPSLDASF